MRNELRFSTQEEEKRDENFMKIKEKEKKKKKNKKAVKITLAEIQTAHEKDLKEKDKHKKEDKHKKDSERDEKSKKKKKQELIMERLEKGEDVELVQGDTNLLKTMAIA